MENSESTIYIRGKLLWPEESRDEIPIKYITQRIKNVIPEYGGVCKTSEDRVFIIQAGTGAGKSTIMPPEIFRIFRNEGEGLTKLYSGKDVICTQPRIITAVGIASYIGKRGKSKDLLLGFNVGYQTGPLKVKPSHGLLYATIGVLSMQMRLLDDITIMDMYRLIIIDEVHERSIEADMTLMRLADFYRRNVGNERLPVLILTSATMDPKLYMSFFDIGPKNFIQVVGTTPYPVAKVWEEQDVKSMFDEIIRIIGTVVKKNKQELRRRDFSDRNVINHDILVFITAIRKTLMEKFEKRLSKLGRDVRLMQLDRSNVLAKSKDYRLITKSSDRLKDTSTWIIFSTPVAETGVTIPTLGYVIDTCWNNSAETHFPGGLSGLLVKPYTKNRFQQRTGRVGRVSGGTIFTLCTKETHDDLREQQYADIVLKGVNVVISDMIFEQQRQKKTSGIKPQFFVNDMKFIDNIPVDSLWYAVESMTATGFISSESQHSNYFEGEPGITKMGAIFRKMSRHTISQARFAMSAQAFGIDMNDVANMIAMLDFNQTDFFVNSNQMEHLLIYDVLPEFIIQKSEDIIQSKLSDMKDKDAEKARKYAAYKLFCLLVSDNVIVKGVLLKAALILIERYTEILADESHSEKEEISYLWKLIDKTRLKTIIARRNEIIEDYLSAGFRLTGNDKMAMIKSWKSRGIQKYRNNAYIRANIGNTGSKLDFGFSGKDSSFSRKDSLRRHDRFSGFGMGNDAGERFNMVYPDDDQKFMDYILLVKQCMFDGNRNKILERISDTDPELFADKFGNKVKVPMKLFGSDMAASEVSPEVATESNRLNKYPSRIIADSINIKLIQTREEKRSGTGRLIYENVANNVSAVNGFIDIDHEMMSYRYVSSVKYGRGFSDTDIFDTTNLQTGKDILGYEKTPIEMLKEYMKLLRLYSDEDSVVLKNITRTSRGL